MPDIDPNDPPKGLDLSQFQGCTLQSITLNGKWADEEEREYLKTHNNTGATIVEFQEDGFVTDDGRFFPYEPDKPTNPDSAE